MGVNGMNRKEIHFTIKADGAIESTVKGAAGEGCEAIAKELALLGRVVKKERTAEYFCRNSAEGWLEIENRQ